MRTVMAGQKVKLVNDLTHIDPLLKRGMIGTIRSYSWLWSKENGLAISVKFPDIMLADILWKDLEFLETRPVYRLPLLEAIRCSVTMIQRRICGKTLCAIVVGFTDTDRGACVKSICNAEAYLIPEIEEIAKKVGLEIENYYLPE